MLCCEKIFQNIIKNGSKVVNLITDSSIETHFNSKIFVGKSFTVYEWNFSCLFK